MKLGKGVGLLLFAGIAAWLYAGRDGAAPPDPVDGWHPKGETAGFACRIPYRVRLGEIDPAFGMSRGDLEGALREAFAVWEDYARRPLFEVVADAQATPVHLRFDERQARSDSMREERQEQADRAAEIQRLRDDLEASRRQHERRRAELEAAAERYTASVRTYEQWVAAFNRAPTRSASEQRRLASEREALERENLRLRELQAEHQRDQERFNREVEAYNREVARLNDRSRAAAAASAGHGPVGAGRYMRTPAGESIEVYLVTSYADLVLTLAHELGHALGIGHVAAADAIMSAVNTGAFEQRSGPLMLKRDDRDALETVCAGRL